MWGGGFRKAFLVSIEIRFPGSVRRSFDNAIHDYKCTVYRLLPWVVRNYDVLLVGISRVERGSIVIRCDKYLLLPRAWTASSFSPWSNSLLPQFLPVPFHPTG